ncbi:putative ORFan [Tupanvirus deep ocean]|uniref:ORFan n=2 Tax=Tupanvirus TaxID=2094720 RepID=A0AC62A9E3_9VIRU|nr:putative ORFan [Tupanvirus deep ocean]QKU34258.1 putative ORFan [Tupanvirus deep ocean]
MARCNNCRLREGKYTVFNQYLNLPNNLLGDEPHQKVPILSSELPGAHQKPSKFPKILRLVKHQHMNPPMISFAISERLCIHCYHAKQNNQNNVNNGDRFGQ